MVFLFRESFLFLFAIERLSDAIPWTRARSIFARNPSNELPAYDAGGEAARLPSGFLENIRPRCVECYTYPRVIAARKRSPVAFAFLAKALTQARSARRLNVRLHERDRSDPRQQF